MPHLAILLTVLALASIGFRMGRGRALACVGGQTRHLQSRLNYYGSYVLLWCGLPALTLFFAWLAIEPLAIRWLVIADLPRALSELPSQRLDLIYIDIRALARGDEGVGSANDLMQNAAYRYTTLSGIGFTGLAVFSVVTAAVGVWIGRRRITAKFAARQAIEKTVRAALIAGSCLAILTTIGIVLSLLFETIRFFEKVPIWSFLFGLEWSPQTALRADQIGSSGSFGALPIFAGTFLIGTIAMIVAIPIGLFSAIYLAEYASTRVRDVVKPLLELLAGIPTVVYGFFAALTVAPLLRDAGAMFNLDISSESALAAGLVMGVMIIPFISSLSDDIITAVPRTLRDGSYSLGATKSETITRVVLPAALPGIVASILLAVSRAIGETMIVVMAAGLAANLTANPFAAVTTVTVQIVTLLVGDQEFDSAKTLAAFALGLMLFVITLGLNLVAFTLVRRYREKYD
ncbi:MAG: phosphate ABC transporter permease subunit PstC [Proteobacteria bacterium]|nr:phosphate ABC transporter permease subunit PstC [Pseudomonadota bacterium]